MPTTDRNGFAGLVRDMLVPTLAAALMLAVLVGLGFWQVDRLMWKNDLTARINARAKAPATELTMALDEWEGSRDVEYVHARASGRFLHDAERYLYTPDPQLGPGVNVLTPLRLADGKVLWVNRGFVPDRLKPPETRQAGQVAGDVVVTGLLRASQVKPRFSPGNDVARNVWLWRDIPELTRSAFGDKGTESLPFMMEADAGQSPGGWPRGGVTRVVLMNDHLQYALTWFGLAVTLVGVWLVYAIKRWRQRQES